LCVILPIISHALRRPLVILPTKGQSFLSGLIMHEFNPQGLQWKVSSSNETLQLLTHLHDEAASRKDDHLKQALRSNILVADGKMQIGCFGSNLVTFWVNDVNRHVILSDIIMTSSRPDKDLSILEIEACFKTFTRYKSLFCSGPRNPNTLRVMRLERAFELE